MTSSDYRSLAGYRHQRRNDITGQPVVVYDATAQGMDASDGRWMIVCEGHSELVVTDTLALARSAAREPQEWCSQCQDVSA